MPLGTEALWSILLGLVLFGFFVLGLVLAQRETPLPPWLPLRSFALAAISNAAFTLSFLLRGRGALLSVAVIAAVGALWSMNQQRSLGADIRIAKQMGKIRRSMTRRDMGLDPPVKASYLDVVLQPLARMLIFFLGEPRER